MNNTTSHPCYQHCSGRDLTHALTVIARMKSMPHTGNNIGDDHGKGGRLGIRRNQTHIDIMLQPVIGANIPVVGERFVRVSKFTVA